MANTPDQEQFALAQKSFQDISLSMKNYFDCRTYLVQTYTDAITPGGLIPKEMYIVAIAALRDQLELTNPPKPNREAPKQDTDSSWAARSHTAIDSVSESEREQATKWVLAENKRKAALDALRSEKIPTIYYDGTNRIDHAATVKARADWAASCKAREAELFAGAEREDEHVVVYTAGGLRNHAATERAREAARQKNKENGLG